MCAFHNTRHEEFLLFRSEDMPAMCIALALAIVVVAAIAIVKKLDVRIVLLVAGMALNILALAFGA